MEWWRGDVWQDSVSASTGSCCAPSVSEDEVSADEAVECVRDVNEDDEDLMIADKNRLQRLWAIQGTQCVYRTAEIIMEASLEYGSITVQLQWSFKVSDMRWEMKQPELFHEWKSTVTVSCCYSLQISQQLILLNISSPTLMEVWCFQLEWWSGWPPSPLLLLFLFHL